MLTAVPPPPPPSSVLLRLGKTLLPLQEDAAFIGSAAIGARECTSKGGPH